MRGRRKAAQAATAEVATPAVQSEVIAGDSSPAVAEDQGKTEEIAFPRTLRVENNTFQTHAFPLIDAIVGPHSAVDAEFSSADQLKRFKADIEQLNFLFGAGDAINVVGE